MFYLIWMDIIPGPSVLQAAHINRALNLSFRDLFLVFSLK